jgi:hypothetical protein
MDSETLKIILELQRKIYDRAIVDILLSIHHDNVMYLNYNIDPCFNGTVHTILNEIEQLKSKARLYDELQQQPTNQPD